MGYTYAMSDLHGSFQQYRQILSQIGFSEKDRLYILGDVTDRKPQAAELLLDVMGRENATLLLGNHEHMMIDYIEDRASAERKQSWLTESGGSHTLRGFQKLPRALQYEVMDYLNTRCPVFLSGVSCAGNVFRMFHSSPVQHCTIPPACVQKAQEAAGKENASGCREKNLLAEIQRRDSITLQELEAFAPVLRNTVLKTVLWTRLSRDAMPEGAYIYLYGHTPVFQYDPAYQDGRPARIWSDRQKRKFNLDCGIAPYRCSDPATGRVGCLRLDDFETFYA